MSTEVNREGTGLLPFKRPLLDGQLGYDPDTGQVLRGHKGLDPTEVDGGRTYLMTFTETLGEDSTYTATLVVPAGFSVVDMRLQNTVLWTAATAASLVVGDADDANGYYEATNVKTTPALAIGSLDLVSAAGAYKGGKYYASAGLITATVTTDDDGTNGDGRTRLMITMVPAPANTVPAFKAAV